MRDDIDCSTGKAFAAAFNARVEAALADWEAAGCRPAAGGGMLPAGLAAADAPGIRRAVAKRARVIVWQVAPLLDTGEWSGRLADRDLLRTLIAMDDGLRERTFGAVLADTAGARSLEGMEAIVRFVFETAWDGKCHLVHESEGGFVSVGPGRKNGGRVFASTILREAIPHNTAAWEAVGGEAPGAGEPAGPTRMR